ncbi:EamA/RhaT family transporter [Aquirufa rosea]|uniref:EamA/RhaT family transporter n=1 Tax=Aquirufa rosea TaxID=2509241 RepID=A0A4Q1C2P7_9BACT|nr:EamA/RhaT family transporter [Aquirufa rosea]RXK52544.1 EamA/RhaT family transporter [Aquirufa rosea]
MLYFILSVVFSVLLLVNFRIHAKYQVDTSLTILLNYPICFLTGWAVQPNALPFHWPDMPFTIAMLALGLGFVVTFLLTGYSTQKNGMATTSLANNISLVIPVLFNLLIWNRGGATWTWQVVAGLILAFGAIYFCSPALDGKGKNKSLTALLLVFVGYGITNTAFNFLNAEVSVQAGGTIPFMLMIVLGAIVASVVEIIRGTILGNFTWNKASVWAAFPLGLPNFFSFYFLLKTLDYFNNNGAIVLPIFNIGVIVGSTAVAYLFFKEKISKRQGIGISLGCVAIVLLLQ